MIYVTCRYKCWQYSFSISPRYISKEESFDLVLVNSDVRLSAKGLTLNEEIELFDYDFVSLRNKLELLVSDKEDVVSWNTEEETIFFSITKKDQCFIWNLRYIIGGKEDDFLNFNFVLSETDMNSIISELYSIIDWVNMS